MDKYITTDLTFHWLTTPKNNIHNSYIPNTEKIERVSSSKIHECQIRLLVSRDIKHWCHMEQVTPVVTFLLQTCVAPNTLQKSMKMLNLKQGMSVSIHRAAVLGLCDHPVFSNVSGTCNYFGKTRNSNEPL
jgi:hypothetical protein